MSSPDNHPLPAATTAAIATGANSVKAVRRARGYSIEDLAETCGLAISEITSIESGDDADPVKLRRIASALQVSETILIGS